MVRPTRVSDRAWRLLAACFLIALRGGTTTRAADVDDELRREIEVRGTALAIVQLHAETPPFESRQPDARRRVVLHAAVDRVVARLPERCELRHRYRFTAALALRISGEEALNGLAAHPDVAKITRDVGGRGALVEGRALTGVDGVFELGLTGAGRVVAILDTGVDTDHPDLAGAVVHAYHIFGGVDTGPGAEDDHGHGTHVAGIIASRGVEGPRGIAPDCDIVAIKILSANNRGFLTDWAAGVEHVIELHESGLRVDVINMSLASDALYPGVCDNSVLVFRNACQAARDRGIVLVASSGDSGSLESIRSPACYSSVLAVGASSSTPPEVVSSFADRNGAVDLVAPGEAVRSTGIGGGTVTESGTSQACALVSGVAVLVRQITPELHAEGVGAILRATGVPVADAGTGLTFPRVDALAAIVELAGDEDCDESGQLDRIELAIGTHLDLDHNGVPDICDNPPFLRGDVNLDRLVNLSDPVSLFGALFDSRELHCESAADSNADGQLNITDAVYTLNFLFAAGDAPPAPYPECGSSVGEALGCGFYPACG